MLRWLGFPARLQKLRSDEEGDMHSTSRAWSSEESIEKLEGQRVKLHPLGNRWKSHNVPLNRMLPRRVGQQPAQAAMELQGRTDHSRTNQGLHCDYYKSESETSLFLTLREQSHRRVLLALQITQGSLPGTVRRFHALSVIRAASRSWFRRSDIRRSQSVVGCRRVHTLQSRVPIVTVPADHAVISFICKLDVMTAEECVYIRARAGP
jgi:hypothetical protein